MTTVVFYLISMCEQSTEYTPIHDMANCNSKECMELLIHKQLLNQEMLNLKNKAKYII